MDIEKIDLLEQKMILFHQHDPIRIMHMRLHSVPTAFWSDPYLESEKL